MAVTSAALDALSAAKGVHDGRVSDDSARVSLIKQEQNALGQVGRRCIYLVDGGIADNLEPRRRTDYVAQAGGA